MPTEQVFTAVLNDRNYWMRRSVELEARIAELKDEIVPVEFTCSDCGCKFEVKGPGQIIRTPTNKEIDMEPYEFKEQHAVPPRSETPKHTPVPWCVVSGAIETKSGIPIAHMDREPGNGTEPVERDENADFIVRAVNSHDYMLEACKEISGIIVECTTNPNEAILDIAEVVLKAIAKATGEYLCKGCGRPELECSQNPCKAVIADRGE